LAGREFQIFGAKIRKAREPNSRLHRGTESRREEKHRRVRTGSWSRSNSARQGGWPVCNALYAKVASLKRQRHSIGRQWRFWRVRCLTQRH